MPNEANTATTSLLTPCEHDWEKGETATLTFQRCRKCNSVSGTTKSLATITTVP